MKFEEKYSMEVEAGKIKLSADFYAIGEMLQTLHDKIEHLRLSLLK